jgi:4-amino-4-deoxy-L-arabinose transferase-like glycosyltransferase
MLVAHRYGFHRDELYFIEGGHHPAWAQPDNPILVPLLAAGWHDLVGGNLILFRVLPALAGVGTILLASLTAREVSGSRRAQVLTALMVAGSSFPLAVGHLFSISTFDLVLTTLVLLLLIRAIRIGTSLRAWLAVGVVSGIALEVKVLLALVLASCLLGVLAVGPRAALRRPGPWLAAAITLVGAAPNLIWQAGNSWPMLEVARSIASGGSTSSADRVMIIPLLLLLISPLLCWVLILGLVATFASPPLREYRWITVAFAILLATMIITGGKPYYLGGFFPVGLALGSGPLVAWLDRSRRRTIVAVVVFAIFLPPTVTFALPVAPVGSTAFQVAVAVNPDTAETVGWSSYIDAVAAVVARTPGTGAGDMIILARNYGEAGALSRTRRLGPGTAADTGSPSATPLPPVYSGHNAYAEWGPPPESGQTAVVVGDFTEPELTAWFAECERAATYASPSGVDNEEDGAAIRVCQRPRATWAALWPQIARLG